ncbi:MAG: endonuclease III [Clostridioides sp.]|jgi:endonuclease-3|nr:endonuclease III [Clostridioides sp.]
MSEINGRVGSKPLKKNKKNINEILDLLEVMYPNAKCELDYTTAFELLIATILSAQCTDVRVNKVTAELFKKYNTPEAFAVLRVGEIEEEIKTCGLYRSKASKIKETSIKICEEFGGEVPDKLEDIVKLPGVGRKTAGVVLSNAFGVPAIPVDTHVFRVANRIGMVKESTPEKTELALMEVIPKKRWSHTHHTLIFHGRRTCKARKPECQNCMINKYCDYFYK